MKTNVSEQRINCTPFTAAWEVMTDVLYANHKSLKFPGLRLTHSLTAASCVKMKYYEMPQHLVSLGRRCNKYQPVKNPTALDIRQL